MTDKKPYRILSLDGGGIRGLTSAIGSPGVMLISFNNINSKIPGLNSWLGAIAESQDYTFLGKFSVLRVKNFV